MFYGILNLSFWGYVVFTLVVTHITIVAVTVYLHRCQAHRSLEVHPILAHFFRLWLWLTTGMVTKAWAAIHRKHHAKCEMPEDPHSPQILGLKKVLWEGAELYRAEAKNEETLTRYGHGTPDDWVERHIYTPYSSKGILLMLLIDVVLLGIPGITVWAIQMMWIPFFAAGIINGVGHYWGYRNFECPDAARNIVPWGILIGGEELHNNHHTFPTSAKLSVKAWEFDIGWLYINLFRFLKLVRVKKTPPKVRFQPSKLQIDMDTVKALLTNRFQVMARYSKEVIFPVLHEERSKVGAAGANLLRNARKLLVRTESLVGQQEKQELMQVLETRENLKVVYDYRMKLQEIWSKTTANQRELLEAVQEWCHQAESSSVEALRKFAARLSGYVPT